MRKGQKKILEKACKLNYNDCCINLLSRENLTLNQLDKLFYILYQCKDKTKEWIEAFTSIDIDDDLELMQLIISYMIENKIDIPVEELKLMSSRDMICNYFSQNGVICTNFFDVKVVMKIGFHKYTAALFNCANKIRNLGVQLSENEILGVVHKLSDCLENASDYYEFLNGIDIEILCQNQTMNDNKYLNDYINEYANRHIPFMLKDVDGIPFDIQQMDFGSYYVEIAVNRYSRTVKYDLKAVYINCFTFSKVIVSDNIITKAKIRIEKKIIFINKTQMFITGYRTKKGENGFKYKPTELRELFSAISICDEDSQDAYSVINFLCNKYDTYIFKDLYEDFLASEGLLLPILITEAAQYKTKQELFDKHYKSSIRGNWNRRNANLTYIIQKLKPRLTKEALARAMQCKTVPKIRKVGKKRYIMAFILYETMYGVNVGNGYDQCLLSDALYEEYHRKIIKLLPEKLTIKEHNERQLIQKAKDVKFKIRKNTRFKTLINNMPECYELIRTPKRLAEEGILQKNCVASYDRKINSDKCMIYSVKYENVRHTIEIVFKNGHYDVAQCFKSCNGTPNPILLQELDDILSKINSKTKI